MKHIITIKITTKEKIAKVLHEIELTCNELVERDEDLKIKHEYKRQIKGNMETATKQPKIHGK
jgi:hypothetical protein